VDSVEKGVLTFHTERRADPVDFKMKSIPIIALIASNEDHFEKLPSCLKQAGLIIPS
jgi:hypothetical protein